MKLLFCRKASRSSGVSSSFRNFLVIRITARGGRRLGQHARYRYRLPHRSITEVANGDRTGERGRYRRVGREIMTVETNSRRLPVLAEHGGGVDQPGLFLG